MNVPYTPESITVTAEKASALDYWSLDGTLKWPDVITFVYKNGVEETEEHVPSTITMTQASAPLWVMPITNGHMDEIAYIYLTFGLHDTENGTKWRIRFNLG